ncbi:type IV secretion system protein [Hephaestia mangrovi]|uniref:type IV secretion system protein n=1 Tax=Hephaestia mangrovi TaxID=2873268 RepID=UPI001CA64723|nr:type IV secretion system protein [Hephaestia mangrovi]MBY8826570.1 type IV secretion system protein [Hephaestia mangrovi]
MIAPCSSVPGAVSFAPGVIGFLDCQAQMLGAQGYQALAAPGSTVSALLTILLTLFVAFIGYRMLFGQVPTIREGVLACVKIGIVLVLATSWPAYQRVIYDVVLHEPAELAAEVGGAAGLPGSAGGLVARLDNADRSFEALAVYGVGQPPAAAGQAGYPPVVPPLFIGFDTFALGAARVAFLAGAIGAFAVLRIAGGYLLAVGPLFIAFLLFDGTRGLFEGWLRAVIGVALGALATSIVLGIELALFEPWLADLLARRSADLAITGAPAQLLAIAVIFAAVLGIMLALMARIAFSWKLPVAWPASAVWSSGSSLAGTTVAASPVRSPITDRSRALIVADAVSAIQRRETQGATAAPAAPGRITAQASRDRDATAPSLVPLGRSFPNRTARRVSASAGRRDQLS